MKPRLSFVSLLLALGGLILFGLAPSAAFGQVSINRELTLRGSVAAVDRDTIEVQGEDGKLHTLKLQPAGARGVMLSTGALLRFPAKVSVVGEFEVDTLERGDTVRVSARLNRRGEVEAPVDEVVRISDATGGGSIEAEATPEDAREFAMCVVTGEVQRLSRGRLVVETGRNDFVRKSYVAVPLADGCRLRSISHNHQDAAPGAVVEKAVVAVLSTGDQVVRRLDIRISEETLGDATFDEALKEKHRRLSNEPMKPRLVRSRHFAFQTDLSERRAAILLDKLETMVELLSGYFGRKPTGLVQGYIVRDLKQWPEGSLPEPGGVAKIREGAGVCFSTRRGSRATATVYAAAKDGVVQHECTHAFCTMTFGSTGPTWLSEGVAEMGQYWRADDSAVRLPGSVVRYLQKTEPKKSLGEIALPGKTDPGDWRDYAWRWALCHLLANNPNYSDRFRPLAVGLMTDQPGASFVAAYGPVRDAISFEYDQFLATFENGYEARLCAWPWGRPFASLRSGRDAQASVAARAGWQASGVRVSADEKYHLAATGEWSVVASGKTTTADGESDGRGRLLGVVMTGYELSKPFPLGADAEFTPPADGDLYLRCRDKWGALADNSGELEVTIRLAE